MWAGQVQVRLRKGGYGRRYWEVLSSSSRRCGIWRKSPGTQVSSPHPDKSPRAQSSEIGGCQSRQHLEKQPQMEAHGAQASRPVVLPPSVPPIPSLHPTVTDLDADTFLVQHSLPAPARGTYKVASSQCHPLAISHEDLPPPGK